MTGSYDHFLVALSVVVAAIFASYAVLDLAGRVTVASGWGRRMWLSGGAIAMDFGIWSMHYIGMLAFRLPVPVAYDWPTVLLSLGVANLQSLWPNGPSARKRIWPTRAPAALAKLHCLQWMSRWKFDPELFINIYAQSR